MLRIGRSVADRLNATPALHLADQVLSSGTNFLAVVVVARRATPEEFGMFSVLLVTFFITAGFNRSVPHAIAMTIDWQDNRARNSYFFMPPLLVGALATAGLAASFAVLDHSWLALPFFLLPMLLQDAVRMHAFAIHEPAVALLSDAVWLIVEVAGFLLVSTAPGATIVWGFAGLCALLVTRPWRIRVRVQRRPIRANVVSAALEYAATTGVGYLTIFLASPIITVLGVGALQGANMIRGPITLLVQGLLVHRMAGPPISSETCVREALRLSGTTLAITVLLTAPLFLLRETYGPHLLGATWPQVDPLVLPALLSLVVFCLGFGPATVVRKMGRFRLSAKVQTFLTPAFIAFPLAGAATGGAKGFLYATMAAYATFGLVWWKVLTTVSNVPRGQTP